MEQTKLTSDEVLQEIIDCVECIQEVCYRIPFAQQQKTEAFNNINNEAEDYWAKKLNDYEDMIMRRKKDICELINNNLKGE